jgi:hypothetical protein
MTWARNNDDALGYGKVTHNSPGGYVVQYNLGKVIGTDKAGNAVKSIHVNVRDGVIHTVYPY